MATLFIGSALMFFLLYEVYMILSLWQLYGSDHGGLVLGSDRGGLVPVPVKIVKILCALVTGVALVVVAVMSKC